MPQNTEAWCICFVPLLPEQAHSVATVKHSRDQIKEATLYLNADQIPVGTVTQQVLAFQKSWPTFWLIKRVEYGWKCGSYLTGL